jgi:hypothetical protein
MLGLVRVGILVCVCLHERWSKIFFFLLYKYKLRVAVFGSTYFKYPLRWVESDSGIFLFFLEILVIKSLVGALCKVSWCNRTPNFPMEESQLVFTSFKLLFLAFLSIYVRFYYYVKRRYLNNSKMSFWIPFCSVTLKIYMGQQQKGVSFLKQFSAGFSASALTCGAV